MKIPHCFSHCIVFFLVYLADEVQTRLKLLLIVPSPRRSQERTEEWWASVRASIHPFVRAPVRPEFPTIIWKSNHSIQFKFSWGICGVGVKNWVAFGRRWTNFGPLEAKKDLTWVQMMVSDRYLKKVFVMCALIGWVFRIDWLLGHVGQILAL